LFIAGGFLWTGGNDFFSKLMSDFLSNRQREERPDRDALAADALRSAGVVVGVSLAAVAVLFAVRRLSAASNGWRRLRDDGENGRAGSANQETPSAVPSPAERGFGSADLVDDQAFAGVGELPGEEDELDDGGEALPADVVQLTTRRRLPDGKEAIEQFVRCTFADSDPLGVVHVAFCPPLVTMPTVEVDQLDGPEAAVKTTLAEAFGTRLEVRLAERAEQGTEVVLRVYAVG